MGRLPPEIEGGPAAFRSALVGNLLVMLASASILLEPPGSAIRPMHLPILGLITSLVTVRITLSFVISAVRQYRHAGLAILGLVLSLGTAFVGYATFATLVWWFNYTLKP